jgi:hypothetical protein
MHEFWVNLEFELYTYLNQNKNVEVKKWYRFAENNNIDVEEKKSINA